MDEKLEKTKANIFQAKENVLKKKAEVKKIHNEEQLFNAKDCFDLQPSWFDTLLPSDIGCLEVNNYPVQASYLDAKNTNGSSDKALKPKDSEAAKANACQLQHPLPPTFVPVKGAVTPSAGQNKPLPGEDVEAKAVTSIQTTPVSEAAKAEAYHLKKQPPPIAVAHFNRAEVDMADTPVAGKHSVDSTKTDDDTSSKPNPFRKIKGEVRQLQPPPPLLFVPGGSAVTLPLLDRTDPSLEKILNLTIRRSLVFKQRQLTRLGGWQERNRDS